MKVKGEYAALIFSIALAVLLMSLGALVFLVSEEGTQVANTGGAFFILGTIGFIISWVFTAAALSSKSQVTIWPERKTKIPIAKVKGE
jgi:hypothetical protein